MSHPDLCRLSYNWNGISGTMYSVYPNGHALHQSRSARRAPIPQEPRRHCDSIPHIGSWNGRDLPRRTHLPVEIPSDSGIRSCYCRADHQWLTGERSPPILWYSGHHGRIAGGRVGSWLGPVLRSGLVRCRGWRRTRRGGWWGREDGRCLAGAA